MNQRERAHQAKTHDGFRKDGNQLQSFFLNTLYQPEQPRKPSNQLTTITTAVTQSQSPHHDTASHNSIIYLTLRDTRRSFSVALRTDGTVIFNEVLPSPCRDANRTDMSVWTRTGDSVTTPAPPQPQRQSAPKTALRGDAPRAYLQPGGESEWKVESENISARSAIFFQKGLF